MKTKITYLFAILFIGIFSVYSQYTVTGKVTDDAGYALPGVSVSVKGTQIGTMTLADGTFLIQVPEGSNVLIFSYIGMETLETEISSNVVNIVMQPSQDEIEEIVVTSYSVSRPFRRLKNKRNNKSVTKGSTSGVKIRGAVSLVAENEHEFNTEEYDHISENGFKNPKDDPLSTLSIDVDNASYSNVRRFLNSGQLPEKDAVRIEEMINYFTYDYPEPEGEHPFSFITEYSECPWNKDNKLLHVGIQGKRLDYNELKPSNFVFLIDVSGSMSSHNKLPLLKQSLYKLVDNLGRKDKVTIVVYAGAAGLVLPPTGGNEKEKIKNAISKLESGGSTAGGAGIKLAYKQAKEAFIEDGNNRVILATDGDFNVGVSSTSSMVRLIEDKRKDDIYLTILGYGMGNYKDGRMEQISNAGNGNYFYIDNLKEAEKVFGKEMRANLFTIAKDVKIQIEFNPINVKGYRLIGYENRLMNKEDFNDDTKDAGELGPGHTVTAIYEIVSPGKKQEMASTDKLKYQTAVYNGNSKFKDELMTLKFRYKPPKEDESILIEHVVSNESIKLSSSSDNFRFSASVAAFGMMLRDSEYKGNINYIKIEEMAKSSRGVDKNAYRKEFVQLVKKAKEISEGLAEK